MKPVGIDCEFKQLSRRFVAAFNAKDAAGCADLMIDHFVFEHPVVKRVVGKAKAARFLQSIFNSCRNLSFVESKIFAEGNITIVEFVLTLDNRVFTGVDIIEWKNGKMRAIRRSYRDV